MVKRRQAYVDKDNAVACCERWLATVRASVAPRPWLELVPATCALVIVDMLRYFADPEGRCFLPATRVATPRITDLLAAWRRQDGTVIFTRHGHRDPADLGMLGRFYTDHIRCDEPDAEIIAELQPAPGEAVLHKTTYDAFLGTELEALLRASGCRQVLVVGVLTHLCCETTARAAFCRGFEVYLAVDALASSSEGLHLGSLHGLADGVAVLHSTAEVLSRCRDQR